MSRANLYPVFLNLKNKICLIAGFGRVGQRKFLGLAPREPALIRVRDPRSTEKLPESIAAALKNANVDYRARPCDRDDIVGCALVFACADDAAANAEIRATCADLNIFCDSATEPDLGSFVVPAVARSGSLIAAVSTSGGSPALAAALRRELEPFLKEKSALADFMGELRPLILKSFPDQPTREKFIKNVLASHLPRWLASSETEKISEFLKTRFPADADGEINALIGRL